MAEQDEITAAPHVAVGATFESMSPAEDAPRRRVQVLEVFGDHATVVNVSSRHQSAIRVDRFTAPHWRFVA